MVLKLFAKPKIIKHADVWLKKRCKSEVFASELQENTFES